MTDNRVGVSQERSNGDLGAPFSFQMDRSQDARPVLCSFRSETSPGSPDSEQELQRLIGGHGCTIANMNYHHDKNRGFSEYGMVIRTDNAANVQRLVNTLHNMVTVQEFKMSPMGD